MSVSVFGSQMVTRSVMAESTRPANEVMVFCPSCKAFQTVWFTDGALNQTRKFMQYGNHIYHDCGCSEPCRLYNTI